MKKTENLWGVGFLAFCLSLILVPCALAAVVYLDGIDFFLRLIISALKSLVSCFQND